jgi:hypothetical protein|tara:strand:+ start:330 stop:620 length:291 start_codon:yes stop_codon:yes gene_type:complete
MELNKKLMFAQFNKLKSNQEKAKYLINLKTKKQESSHLFRGIKIKVKQFDNLIKEYQSVVPFGRMHKAIAEAKAAEKLKEKTEKSGKSQFKELPKN